MSQPRLTLPVTLDLDRASYVIKDIFPQFKIYPDMIGAGNRNRGGKLGRFGQPEEVFVTHKAYAANVMWSTLFDGNHNIKTKYTGSARQLESASIIIQMNASTRLIDRPYLDSSQKFPSSDLAHTQIGLKKFSV